MSAAQAIIEAVSDSANFVAVRYAVPSARETWALPEGNVPESTSHYEIAEYIRQVLLAWAESLDRPVRVARNLAIRWQVGATSIGVDPDVCVLDPRPGAESISSLRLWQPGELSPTLCFEVVSANHPHKDYRDLHERYANVRARELVVFDPELAGPRALGGPLLFQLWRRAEDGTLERVATGDGPLRSEVLGCYISAKHGQLAFSDQPSGAGRWLTREERERAAAQRERAEKERALDAESDERAEKERAEAEVRALAARVAELEERLG